MRGKQILRALLRPHIAVLLVLLPLAAAALPYAMLTLDEQSPVRIGVYVLSAYTLTVWCVRVPDIIRFFRTFRQENKYARRWLSDTRLRVNVTLSASALFNAAYAAPPAGSGTVSPRRLVLCVGGVLSAAGGDAAGAGTLFPAQ